MKRKWIYSSDPRWKDLRIARLKKGLKFAESIGDTTMCRIITKEMKNVLLR